MPRSGKVVRDRLQRAALELFAEHGFDRTTTGQIAARAGVTERTYFRHFADKREVLFDGETQLREELTAALSVVPDGADPIPALRIMFREVVPMLEGNRPVSEPRARVIGAAPALQERELAKVAALVEMLGGFLEARGAEHGVARLCAQMGMAAFSLAIQRWMDDPSGGLDSEIERAFRELAEVSRPLAARV